MNDCESWKVMTNYPLLASTNTERAGELIIAHLANGCDDQLLIKLDGCQIICFVNCDANANRPSTETSIILIVYNHELKRMELQKYSLS